MKYSVSGITLAVLVIAISVALSLVFFKQKPSRYAALVAHGAMVVLMLAFVVLVIYRSMVWLVPVFAVSLLIVPLLSFLVTQGILEGWLVKKKVAEHSRPAEPKIRSLTGASAYEVAKRVRKTLVSQGKRATEAVDSMASKASRDLKDLRGSKNSKGSKAMPIAEPLGEEPWDDELRDEETWSEALPDEGHQDEEAWDDGVRDEETPAHRGVVPGAEGFESVTQPIFIRHAMSKVMGSNEAVPTVFSHAGDAVAAHDEGNLPGLNGPVVSPDALPKVMPDNEPSDERYFEKAQVLRDRGQYFLSARLFLECQKKTTNDELSTKAAMAALACLVKANALDEACALAENLKASNTNLSKQDMFKVDMVLKAHDGR